MNRSSPLRTDVFAADVCLFLIGDGSRAPGDQRVGTTDRLLEHRHAVIERSPEAWKDRDTMTSACHQDADGTDEDNGFAPRERSRSNPRIRVAGAPVPVHRSEERGLSLMTTPLDSSIWAQLPTAYGTAESIPELWTECLRKDTEELWYDLLNEVCHQGTPYGVVWALVPHIVEHLSAVSVTGWTVGLEIIATNIRRAPEHPPFEELKAPYDRALARLRNTIVVMLQQRGAALATADDDDDDPYDDDPYDDDPYDDDPYDDDDDDLAADDVPAFEPWTSVARSVCECVCACLGKFAAADAVSSIASDEWFLYVLCPGCNELLRVALTSTGPELGSVDGTEWPNGPPSPSALLGDVHAALDLGRAALQRSSEEWNDRDTLLALAAFAADTLANEPLAAILVGATVRVPCPGCGAQLETLEHLGEEP